MEERREYTQENKKNTLIINYPVMMAGGVETYFAGLMKDCIQKGYRVIWITAEPFLNETAFRELLEDPGLEIVKTRSKMHFLDIPGISFAEDERVIMFTCEPIEYLLSDRLRTEAGTKHFLHYLAIPHYTGNEYYPDRYLKNKLFQKLVYRYLRKLLGRVAEHNCIMGFDPKHLVNYEAYYEIPIPDKNAKIVPVFDSAFPSFDGENTKARCAERNEQFVITSCARFEFPHKAYLLGLVDAFAAVKERHPQAVLQLVGYGSGQQELEDRIKALPDSAQKDIRLLGMLTPEVLIQHYRNSHLVVGLAGAVAQGAESGIPALVVRHCHAGCETYGFFADASEKVICEEPGADIVPFIEACITMAPETYLQHAEKGFESATSFKDDILMSIQECFDQTAGYCPAFVRSGREAFVSRCLYVICSILRHLGR